MQSPAFPAGEFTYSLLLIRAFEVKTARIRARIHFVITDAQNVLSARNRFPYRLVVIQVFPALLHIGDVHRIAQGNGACIRLLGAHNHAKEGRFTGTVTTRSEEHTSELQSRGHLVCRLLLEKKKSTQ